MPKKNCDYSKTVMYKIVCNDLNITDCYVGHTTDFIKRKYAHKNICTNPNQVKHHLNVYKFIRDNGGWNNWAMVELEKWGCTDGNEARARERYWYEQFNTTLNTNIPIVSNDEIKQRKKNYSAINRNSILEYQKKYYIQNKETIIIKDKEYYEIIKVSKLEKAKVKFTCSCGATLCIGNKSEHCKTKKHLDYTNNLEV